LLARKPAHTVFRVTQASTPGLPNSRAASSFAPRRGTPHGLPVALNGCGDEAAKPVERAYRRSHGADCPLNRRVLTDVRAAWHAPAMQPGALRARSLARSADGWTLSHARRRTSGVANSRSRAGRRLATRLPKSVRRHVQGTVGGTVTGRLRASVDHVGRSLAVMNSPFGEWGSGLEEAAQEV
jgi:hypothetical protein